MKRIAVLLALSSLSGCLIGPDYERPLPAAAPSAEYKETMGFRPALPRDAIDRGPWWSIYGDPTLDQLAAQVDISNQNLKVSEAAYRQARALIRQDQSLLYPSIGYTGGSQQLFQGTQRGGGPGVGQFSAGGTLTWEIDVWGRIRRQIAQEEEPPLAVSAA